MQIGEEGKPYVIEPIEEPVPGKTSEPAPPEPKPARREREPEKVPA